MKKVNLEEGNAALERVLLMMKYDMGKTLNENKGIVSEQGQVSGAPKGFRNFYLGVSGAGGFGTDEQKLIDAFNEFTSAQDYVELENYLKKFYKRPNYSIQRAINAELGMGDAVTAEKIQTKLKDLGIQMEFQTTPSGVDVVDNTIRIEVPTGQTPGETPEKTSFGCLSSLKSTGKNKVGCPQYNIGGKKYALCSNGRGLVEGGTVKNWKCDGNKIIFDGTVISSGTKTPFNWVQAPTEEEVRTGKKILKSGMKGDFVTKVQQQLKVKGVDPKGTDGKFGKDTKNAVIKFQENVGFTGKDVDGVVGKNTYAALFRQAAEPANVASKEIKPTTPTLPTGQVQRSSPIPSVQTSHVDPKPTIKESMKKTLKTKLVEKTQEKENLLIETKIITNRFNLLSEGIVVETVEDQVQFIDDIIVEMNYMVSQGYSSQVINEGLFSMLGSLFGGSLKSVPAVFGEYIANWLTKTLGVPEGSFIQSSIVALVGNLNIADYDKFFTDCRFASNKIADSLIEGYLIQMQKRAEATSQGATGFITSALRNAVAEHFLEDKDGIIQILQDKIGDFICPKLNKVSSAIADKADEIKDKAVA